MQMSRAQHIAIWLRMCAEREISLARDSKKLLKAQGTNCSNAYKHDGGQLAVYEEIKKGQVNWVRVLNAHYAITIKQFSQYTKDVLIGGKSRHLKQNFATRIQSFISTQGLNQSKSITATTIDKARAVINSGQANGDSEDAIADALESQIGGVVADSRARTIARTEVHNAATYAMDETASETEELSGIDLTREWVTVEDDRVRGTNPKDEFSHVDADGQTQGMGEPFEVSGELLDRPGDPNGSAGNVINCRCTLTYSATDGSEVDPDDVPDDSDSNPEDFLT
jgi:hypothetical protein